MEVIEKINEIMKEKGISAYKIEKELGIKQTSFHNWRAGMQPPADKIKTILQYLKVDANKVFEIEYIKENNLTENEQEMLNAFKKIPEREQIKEIGRMEEKAEHYKGNKDASTS